MSTNIWSDANNIIIVVELIVYSFVLVLATVILFLRGFKSAVGWRSIWMFAALNIVGDAINLNVAVQEQTHMPSVTLIAVGMSFSSIAMGPLQTAGYSFINRVARVRQPESGSLTTLPARLIKGLSLVLLVATILNIVGFVEVSSDQNASGISMIKASSILFLITFLVILAMAIGVIAEVSRLTYDRTHVLYLYAVLAAAPFFMVRLVFGIASGFSITTEFGAYHKFSIYNGDWTIRLGMMVCMQFGIAIIYCIAGIKCELVTVKTPSAVLQSEADVEKNGFSETSQGR
jgi:hypothetical protein